MLLLDICPFSDTRMKEIHGETTESDFTAALPPSMPPALALFRGCGALWWGGVGGGCRMLLLRNHSGAFFLRV